MKPLLLLLALPVAAHASWFEYEAGLGAAQGVKSDGRWYNAGLPNSTGSTAPSVRLGAQMNVSEPDHFVPGVKLHLTYNWLGSYNWSAIAGEDEDAAHTSGYNPATKSCNNGVCGPERRFETSGWTQTLALTVEPYWNLGAGWHAGFELGPAVYVSKMDSTAINIAQSRFGAPGVEEHFHHVQAPHFGAVGGASVGYKNWTLRYTYTWTPYKAERDGNYVPPAMNGYHQVTLNYNW